MRIKLKLSNQLKNQEGQLELNKKFKIIQMKKNAQKKNKI